ncbi:MAG TPA: hypothetical protein VGM77_10140 [Gemmatimonadales bacterium]|jgi:hypothetical protein
MIARRNRFGRLQQSHLTWPLALGVVLAATPLTAQVAGPSPERGISLPQLPPPEVAAALLADTGQGRPRVAELSDAYYARLHIHLIASYAALPIMGAEYFLGEKLLSEERQGIHPSGSLVGAHVGTAVALSALFGLNTITGVMNLYEARHQSQGRARRTIHSILMLLADGGFAYTASLGGGAKLRRSGITSTTLTGADNHKRAAIASFSVATAATLMMWLWKD